MEFSGFQIWPSIILLFGENVLLLNTHLGHCFFAMLLAIVKVQYFVDEKVRLLSFHQRGGHEE